MQSTYLQEPETLQVSAPRFSRSVRPSQAPHVGQSTNRTAERRSERSTRNFSLAGDRQPEQRNRSRSRRRTRRGSRTSRRSSSNSQSITHVSSITNTYPENPMFPSVCHNLEKASSLCQQLCLQQRHRFTRSLSLYHHNLHHFSSPPLLTLPLHFHLVTLPLPPLHLHLLHLHLLTSLHLHLHPHRFHLHLLHHHRFHRHHHYTFPAW